MVAAAVQAPTAACGVEAISAMDGGEVLGIIKDYLAIARGTLAVSANAALTSGRSVVNALTAIRPGHVAQLRDRSSCPTVSAAGRHVSAEQESMLATVQGEIERVVSSLELVSRVELDSLRQRLAELERQLARQSRLGGASGLDEANR